MESESLHQKYRISLSALLCIFISISSISGQTGESPVIDSLERALRIETQDTSRIVKLCNLSFECSSRNTDKGIEYAEKAQALSRKINWKKGTALSLQFLGRNYWRAGNYKSALLYHQESLQLWIKIGESKQIAALYLYIGQDYADSHDYPKAIEYLGQALELYKSIESMDKISTVHGIIAWIYDNMGMNAEFKKNEMEALRISEELNDTKSIAIYSSNLASELIDQKKYTEAIRVFEQCNATLKKSEDFINLTLGYIEMSRCYSGSGDDVHAMKLLDTALFYGKKVNNSGLIGDVYTSLASILTAKKDHAGAIESLSQAIKYYNDANNSRHLLTAYNLSVVNLIQEKKYAQAADFLNKEKIILRSLGSTATRSTYYQELSALDSATEKWSDAFVHHKMYIAACDSLFREENTKKSAQAHMQYELHKNEEAAHLDEVERDALELQDLTIKEQAQKFRTIIISVILSFVIVLGFVGFYAYKKHQADPNKETDD
ncbi:MAG: tetratricopeptide repeat protein [Bacteroidia bacterium]|jgi:tetratricopeptide (TPR) repeat protein